MKALITPQKTWQILAAVLAIAAIALLVAYRLGVFQPGIADAAVTANDPAISNVSFSVFDNASGATTNYEYNFTTTQTLSSSSTIDFHITGLGSGEGGNFSSDVNAAGGTVSVGSIPATASHPFTSTVRLTLNSSLSPGSYSFHVSGVQNTAGNTCLAIFATTNASANSLSQMTYTGDEVPFGVDSCNSGGGGDEEEGDGQGRIDVPFTASIYGTVVKLDWDTASATNNGQTFTADQYALVYGATETEMSEKMNALFQNGDLSVVEKFGITNTEITMTGFNPNTPYYFSVIALYQNQPVGYTQSREPVRTSKAITSMKLKKPAIGSKTVKKVEFTPDWKAPALQPSSYSMEVYTAANNKKLKNVTNIAASKNKQLVKALKKKTKYKVRVQAVYNNVYNVNTNTNVTVKSAWSDFSSTITTKK